MIRTLLLILAMIFATGPLQAKPAVTMKPGKVITNATNLTSYRWIDARDEATGLRIDDFTLRYGRAGIRIGGDASDIVIRNGTCTTKAVNKGSDLPVCIDLRGTVHDVLIEKVTATNHRMEPVKGKYTNGDGFSTEQGTRNVTFRDTISRDNSDGGYDLKGWEHVLIGAVAERNGRNYRFWGEIDAGTITSVDPRGAHVWIDKGAKRIHIAKLVARSAEPTTVFQFDAKNRGIELTVDACDLTGLAPGSTLIIGKTGNKVTLGAGCSL